MKFFARIFALTLALAFIVAAGGNSATAQIALYPAVAGAGGPAGFCPFQFDPIIPFFEPGSMYAVECLINAERTSRGLPPLRRSGHLDVAAYLHVTDAVQSKWWGPNQNPHVNPVTGITPELRVFWSLYCFVPPFSFSPAKTGEITYTGAGDGYGLPNAAVNWWMNISTGGHRELILDSEFTHLGVWLSPQAADRRLDGVGPAGTYVVVFGTCPMVQ